MQKRTTTRQLNTAITDKLLHIANAELYNKTTHQTDVISPETFRESLDFICESIFADCIGWHYERNHETGNYEIECSRMDGSSNFIVIAYLCANENVDREDIDMALMIIED